MYKCHIGAEILTKVSALTPWLIRPPRAALSPGLGCRKIRRVRRFLSAYEVKSFPSAMGSRSSSNCRCATGAKGGHGNLGKGNARD
jgi:hypothetical protein